MLSSIPTGPMGNIFVAMVFFLLNRTGIPNAVINIPELSES